MATGNRKPRTVDVLLIEDSPEDAYIFKKLLERRKRVRLHLVNSGESALAFLYGKGYDQNVFCPDLIILDLNLPGKKGLEVLKTIKENVRLTKIPAIVLTVSHSERDIDATYAIPGTSFIQKSSDLKENEDAVEALLHYWLDIVMLPPKSNQPCG